MMLRLHGGSAMEIGREATTEDGKRAMMLRLHGGSALEIGREATTEGAAPSSARPPRAPRARAAAALSSGTSTAIPEVAAASTQQPKQKKGGFLRTLKRSVRRSKRGSRMKGAGGDSNGAGKSHRKAATPKRQASSWQGAVASALAGTSDASYTSPMKLERVSTLAGTSTFSIQRQNTRRIFESLPPTPQGGNAPCAGAGAGARVLSPAADAADSPAGFQEGTFGVDLDTYCADTDGKSAANDDDAFAADAARCMQEMEAAAAESEEQNAFLRQMEEAARVLDEEERQLKAAAAEAAEQNTLRLKLARQRREQEATDAAVAKITADHEHMERIRQEADAHRGALEQAAASPAAAAAGKFAAQGEETAAAEKDCIALAAKKAATADVAAAAQRAADTHQKIAAEAAAAQSAEAKLALARTTDKAKRDARVKLPAERKRRENVYPSRSASAAAKAGPAPAEATEPAAKRRKGANSPGKALATITNNTRIRKLPTVPLKQAPSVRPSTEGGQPDARALQAARWTDKEIRKLIAEVSARGKQQDGKVEITFGQLFQETADIFEALSGTCKTAKKYGVVDYDAEQLWQGQNDATVITLLKTVHDGVKVATQRARVKPPCDAKSAGFNSGTLSHLQSKCYSCKKTVYPMEFVGASDKAFHKKCFRCHTCNTMLKPNDYCVSADGMFRCGPHHREHELAIVPAKTQAAPSTVCA